MQPRMISLDTIRASVRWPEVLKAMIAVQGYFQAFLSAAVFFLRRLSFSRKEINFRFASWHEYPWIHSWIHPWYIYVAKTLKLINYVGSLPITLSFHEIQWRWSYFLRGDACGIVLQGFCALVVQCVCLHLAFTQKYLPQFRVSILWKNYEGDWVWKLNWRLSFYYHIGIVQRCLKVFLSVMRSPRCYLAYPTYMGCIEIDL